MTEEPAETGFKPSTSVERRHWLLEWARKRPLEVTTQKAIDALRLEFGKSMNMGQLGEILRSARTEASETLQSHRAIPVELSATPPPAPAGPMAQLVAVMRSLGARKVELLDDGTVKIEV